MKAKYKRLNFIILIFALVSSGLYIILKNFNENIIFFYSPSDLKQKNILNTTIRIGGLVVKDSIKHLSESRIEFTITDQKEEVTIIYQGLLPNLFREGQGIVAKGKYYNSGEKKSIFIANELLAKHDENYMPKEITNSLKNGKCPSCKHTAIQSFGSDAAIFHFHPLKMLDEDQNEKVQGVSEVEQRNVLKVHEHAQSFGSDAAIFHFHRV